MKYHIEQQSSHDLLFLIRRWVSENQQTNHTIWHREVKSGQTQDPELVPQASMATWSLPPMEEPSLQSTVQMFGFLSHPCTSKCGSQQADPNPRSRKPLPVCCLCTFAPLVCFNAGGETFSITEEGIWMVALLVGFLVSFCQDTPHPPPTTVYPSNRRYHPSCSLIL